MSMHAGEALHNHAESFSPLSHYMGKKEDDVLMSADVNNAEFKIISAAILHQVRNTTQRSSLVLD